MTDFESQAAQSGPLANLATGKRVLIMLGAGGVGKTTTAIATAVLGARAGRRVALLSIDPAKRLAAALGIPLSGSPARISLPPELAGTPATGKTIGTIDAAMLDQKAVFDAMVRRHAPTPAIAAKILVHPVYIAASTNLSGPLEYMALAKLQELAANPAYDLIVLDTPPDSHALDFLGRPNVLAGFMENKVMTWLIKPFLMAGRLGLGKVLSASERLMGGVAKVTGVTALTAFAEFLTLMQEVIEGFHRTGEKTVETLRSPHTSFVLVTVPSRAAARSASAIAIELERLGYGLSLTVLNRSLPSVIAAAACDGQTPPGDVGREMLRRRAEGEQTVARELAAELARVSGKGVGASSPSTNFGRVPSIRIEEQAVDLGTPAGLGALATALGAALAAPSSHGTASY